MSIYRYSKIKGTINYQWAYIIIWLLFVKLIWRNSYFFSLEFFITFFVGLYVIDYLYKFVLRKFSEIEINNNEISKKFLGYKFWSIPIISITAFEHAVGTIGDRFNLNTFPRGFVIKANEKKYIIPYDLEQSDNFVKELQSKNLNIHLSPGVYSPSYLGSKLFFGDQNRVQWLASLKIWQVFLLLLGSLLVGLSIFYIAGLILIKLGIMRV